VRDAATLLGATGRLRAAATIATAALPQFTYISATVNPDALAAALASAGLLLLVWIATSARPARRAVAALGAVSAAGVLTEYHAGYVLVLAPVAYLFVLGRSWRATLRDGAIAGAVFVAGAGWWLVWNVVRYGEPTGLVRVAPEYRRTLLDPFFVDYFPRLLYDSFLGAYGWLNLFLPDVWYLGFGLLWLGALWGICRGTIVSHRWPAERRMLVLAPMLILAVVLYRNLSFNAAQGRYLFAALPAISCLFAFGLAELPARLGRWPLVAGPAFLIIANVYSLWFVWSAFIRA
jgi:4-amino-4-deoxy-L-arabinose transferase-like glycosyltransferase